MAPIHGLLLLADTSLVGSCVPTSRLFDCDCLFISAEECPDRELEASADEYPDKELKASVVKELDPPAQTITSVDGCPDRELETSVEGFMGPNKPRWRFLDG
ncbi:hypothetical protein V8E54_003052 [Elaphomyces granulatus]